MMNRRQMLMMLSAEPGGLPAEYLQVEYLESTGAQYLSITETSANYEFDIVASITETRSNIAILTGYRSGDDKNATGIIVGSSSIAVNRRVASTATTNDASVITADYLNDKLQLFCHKDYAKILDASGNVLVENNNIVNSLVSTPIKLFQGNSNSGAYGTRILKAKVYSAKYYLNGTLTYDLVPCIRISDSEPGMYDLVGRQFYTNAGTDVFNAGVEGWDYFIFRKYSDTNRLRPIEIPITAGQTITMAWQGCNSSSYTYRLWGLKNDATFSGESRENLPCGNIPSSLKPDGQLTYTVATSGSVVVGGLNAPGSGESVNAYTFPGDWIKVKIS